jgi:hypothetical protein
MDGGSEKLSDTNLANLETLDVRLTATHDYKGNALVLMCEMPR